MSFICFSFPNITICVFAYLLSGMLSQTTRMYLSLSGLDCSCQNPIACAESKANKLVSCGHDVMFQSTFRKDTNSAMNIWRNTSMND